MELQFINVTNSNVEFASSFISEIFIDYYSPITSKEHATYMANKFLTKEYLSELLKDNAIIKMAYLDDKPIGFLEYLEETDKVFLSKLYLHKDYRNKGYGRILLRDVKEFTLSKGKETIYLTCNKHNPTKDKYLHWGFKIVDSVVNDIGNNYYMDDYIMELSLK